MGSWTVFETPKPFMPFGDGQRWNISMLMSYCLNYGSFYALSEAVDEWDKRDPKKIFQTLREKRNLIETEMRKQFDWTLLSPTAEELQSPLVTFELPPQYAIRGYEVLHELNSQKNVTVSVSPLKQTFAIRLSAHVDISDEEIQVGIMRLKEYFN